MEFLTQKIANTLNKSQKFYLSVKKRKEKDNLNDHFINYIPCFKYLSTIEHKFYCNVKLKFFKKSKILKFIFSKRKICKRIYF